LRIDPQHVPPEKVVSGLTDGNVWSLCGHCSSSDEDFQQENRFSVELDGLLYEFTRGQPMRGKIHGLIHDFPRNSVCCEGTVFSVPLLSVSSSKIAIITCIVVPRMIEPVTE
jgi:hypothetical protein